MIYTVTFNPALDYVISVDHFTPGKINRTVSENMICGGKGINVSALLANLGYESTALGFVAGFTGAEIEKRAKELGFASDFIHVKKGMSRINVKMKSDEETEINGMGPDIQQEDVDALFEKLDGLKVWDNVSEVCESKAVVEGKITEVNKGGLVANMKGVRVFIPASQTGIPKGGDMTGMVGQTVQMKITEVNRSRRRVIGSIRAVTAEARKAAIEKIWNEIEVGKKYHGVVKSLMPYGAFVDIGGVDGMVHVTELTWGRIKTPADVVKVGDEIDVFVLSFDPEKRKISLGCKTAESNPWNHFLDQFSVGDVVPAKIVKLMTFGAFAEIIPGVDGLIHISQIADRRINKPDDVLSEGQDVTVKIIDVDAENKRISLSIRALLNDQDEAPVEE